MDLNRRKIYKLQGCWKDDMNEEMEITGLNQEAAKTEIYRREGT